MTLCRTGKFNRKRLLFCLVFIILVSVMYLPEGLNAAVYADSELSSAQIPDKYKSRYEVQNVIDISNWQGKVSVAQFRKIRKMGVSGVMIRVGYTRQLPSELIMKKDEVYADNIDNAYKAGLRVGAYYYSQAVSEDEAREEARYTVDLLKSRRSKITLPVAFDYEFGSYSYGRFTAYTARNLGSEKMTKISEAFCDEIRGAGYTPLFYGNLSMMLNYVDRDRLHEKYKVWLAHYTSGEKTGYERDMYMWQYSSSESLRDPETGKQIISGRIDMNYLFDRKKTPKPKSTGKWVRQDDGRSRYRTAGGYVKHGWQIIGGRTYYFDAEGYPVTGYRKIGGAGYAFDRDGVLYINQTVTAGGKERRFGRDGREILYRAESEKDQHYCSGPGENYVKKSVCRKGQIVNIVQKEFGWAQTEDGRWLRAKDLKKLKGN